MSPLSLRRYRAERLLRAEFERGRGRVLAVVRARLAARGVALGAIDLDACYAQAWQGLYATMLAGSEIENPAGWLVLVTHRRALEEHRTRARRGRAREAEPPAACTDDVEGDGGLAAALDRRVRLRSWLEGLRRLDEREREAAALCYLHGFSHAQAAARMGLSDGRMRKLMEGRAGHAGVAAKVGAVADTVRAGNWCEQQGSLMRALAYGLLAPGGERRRLAEMHSSACPACRAYVLSLRGLAATMPPAVAPLLSGAGAGTGAGSGSGSGAAASGAGAKAGAGAGTAVPVGGAAGGGWAAVGAPLATKLALGCALAVGVGAGCVALQAPKRASPAHALPPARRAAGAAQRGRVLRARAPTRTARVADGPPPPAESPTRVRQRSPAGARPEAAGAREFTPEQTGPVTPAPAAARAAGAGPSRAGAARASDAREFAPG